MRKLYPILLYAFFLVFLAACATKRYSYKAPDQRSWEQNAPSNAYPITQEVYLIGNTGFVGDQLSPAMLLLQKQLAYSGDRASIVILGNYAPKNGLPKKDDPKREAIEAKIDLQLSIIEGFEEQTYFIPGHFDWNAKKHKGSKGIERLEDYIQEALDEKAFLPSDGCGEVKSKEVAEGVRIIFIDTEWWLYKWSADDNINKGCDLKSRVEFINALRAEINEHKKDQLIIAMYHPLFSNGNTAGFFSLRQHIFPFTDMHPAAYVPLPIVGSLYPLYHGAGATRQDLDNSLYYELKEEILTICEDYTNLVFVSGKEQNMQYFYEDDNHFVNSGSMTGNDYARRGGEAEFAYQARGFSKLIYYANGELWLEFWEVIDKEGNGQVAFRTKLAPEKPQLIYQNPGLTSQNLPDSFRSQASLLYSDKKAFGEMWLGDQYRDAWGTEITLPVFDLTQEHGGLYPVQKGGGFASSSMRMQAPSGKQYVLRSVDKNVAKAFPEEIRKIKALNIMQDQISAIHPYGATAIPPMADAIGVYHTNPKVVYLKHQPMMGVYNNLMDSGWHLYEERPAKNWEDSYFFGNSSKIIGTNDLILKLRQHEKNKVDQEWVLKSRIFDLFIHDWDRHDDQWRWAKFDVGEDNIYQPIPRDRDQVFYKFKGALPSVVAVFVMRKFKSFKKDLKDVPGQSFNAAAFDRYFLNEMTAEDFEKTAQWMQTQLTDSVIENAFNSWPDEIWQLDAPEIIEKLKSRRDNLETIAMKLYDFRAKQTDIRGTDRKDYFSITRLEKGKTHVQVYHLKDVDNGEIEKGELFYDRIFTKKETKEISIYGLMGGDLFEVKGKSKKGSLIRIIGGEGKDVVVDSSKVSGLARKTHVYDKKGDIEIEEYKGEVANKTSFFYKVNEYDRENFHYNTFLPTITFGSNQDDGFFFGLGGTYTKQRFRKEPFAQQHKGAFLVSPKSGAFSLEYSGQFIEVIKRFNFLLTVDILNPELQNYFGEGNDTENTNPDDRFNWMRLKIYRVAPLLEKGVKSGTTSFYFGPLFESQGAENTPGRVLEDPSFGISEDEKKQRYFLGGAIGERVEVVNSQVRPTHGFKQHLLVTYLNSVGESDKGFWRINADFSNYLTATWKSLDFTLANRVGVQTVQGNYYFYHTPSLGTSNHLRGYRNERFRGKTIFYHNIDLRIKFAYWDNKVLPFEFGILGAFDYGRVWDDPSEERFFHIGYTAGVWINPLKIMAINFYLSWSGEEKNFFTLSSHFYF